jgi:MFS family permease
LLPRKADSSYTASIIGAINSLFAAGAAIGALSQGWISDWIGRKKAFALAAALSLAGAALTAGSVAVGMIIPMRAIQGAGLGQLISLVPLYITEVAPPHTRGLLSGMTAASFAIGYVT